MARFYLSAVRPHVQPKSVVSLLLTLSTVAVIIVPLLYPVQLHGQPIPPGPQWIDLAAREPDSDPLPPGAIARLGTQRFRGVGGAQVAFSPDGKYIASADWHGRLSLWDAADGKKLRSFPGPSANITSMSFSRDGKTLFSLSKARNEYLYSAWEVSTAKELRKVSIPRTFYSDQAAIAVLSADGSTVAQCDTAPDPTRNDGGFLSTVAVRDMNTEKVVLTLPTQKYGTFLALSADGKVLATANSGSEICLWKVAGGEVIGRLQSAKAPTGLMVFSPDGHILAAECSDVQPNGTGRVIQLWNVNTGKQLGELEWEATAITFAPDSKSVLISCHDGTVRLFDVETRKLIRDMQPSNATFSLAFSPDGKLAVGGDSSLWDVGTGRRVQPAPGNPISSAQYLAFSPDGKTLVSGGWHELFLWDVAARKPIRYCAPRKRLHLTELVYSPDGSSLAVSMVDFVRPSEEEDRVLKAGKIVPSVCIESVRFWEVASGKEKGHMTLGKDTDSRGIAFVPEDNTKVVVGQQFLRGFQHDDEQKGAALTFFDLTTGKVTRRFTGPKKHSLICWELTRDGRSLVAIFHPDNNFDSYDLQSRVHRWDLLSGNELPSFSLAPGNRDSMALSPDGKNLIVATNTGISIWNLTRGKEIRRFQTKGIPSAWALAPDGRTLAVAVHQGKDIEMWDLENAAIVGRFQGYEGEVTQVAFAPDGKTLASSSNATILLWDLTRR